MLRAFSFRVAQGEKLVKSQKKKIGFFCMLRGDTRTGTEKFGVFPVGTASTTCLVDLRWEREGDVLRCFREMAWARSGLFLNVSVVDYCTAVS